MISYVLLKKAVKPQDHGNIKEVEEHFVLIVVSFVLMQ